MGIESERTARAKGTTKLDLGGVRRDPGPRAGDTGESFERSIAALSVELSAHFAKAPPGPSARSPALAAAGPAAPDLGLVRRADILADTSPRQDRPEGQRREGQRPERQRRQAEEKAGRLSGYAFALPLVSGMGAAAAVACRFYFLSGTGSVTPVKDILNRKEILELQTRLKALGLNPGPLDGVAGAQTATAVRRYEESRGRPTTGFVDRDLLIRLQQEPPSRTTSRQDCSKAGTPSQKPSQWPRC